MDTSLSDIIEAGQYIAIYNTSIWYLPYMQATLQYGNQVLNICSIIVYL